MHSRYTYNLFIQIFHFTNSFENFLRKLPSIKFNRLIRLKDRNFRHSLHFSHQFSLHNFTGLSNSGCLLLDNGAGRGGSADARLHMAEQALSLADPVDAHLLQRAWPSRPICGGFNC